MVLEAETAELGDLFDAGGMPLTDRAAEMSLLSVLLNKPGAITETLEVLQPVDFHDPLHRRLYELLLRAYETDEPPTMASLIAGLGGEKSAGGYIASLMANADTRVDAADLADHIQIISERRATGTVEDIDFNRGKPFTSKFGAQPWEEIGAAGAAAAYPWLVENLIPLNDIAMAFGESGSGKSFAMLDMSLCVARGIKFNGHNVEHGLVVYCAAEAGKGFAKRKIAYSMHHQLDPAEQIPFVLLTKRPNFFQSDTDVTALIEEIRAICRLYAPLPLVLIVIDTMSAVTQGLDEISGKDQAIVRRRLLMLVEEFRASVVIVHHKPKNGTGPRGHGSQTADIETTIEFELLADRKTDTGKEIFKATSRKQREGEKGISWQFTLPKLEVGRNKWGNPETSCVVLPYASGAPKAALTGFHATSTELLFMRALYDAINDHGQPPPAGLPASITKVVEQRHIRVLMRERYIDGHEDSSIADGRFRTAFSRAGNKLRDGAVIGIQGNLFWPTGKAVRGLS